jgi:hypothetical protein
MNRFFRPFASAVVALAWVAVSQASFPEDEAKEEPAGGSCMAWMNPAESVYGFSVGFGMWVRNTPVFGDYFLRLTSSQLEDAWYLGGGLTIRALPHGRVAPFVGAGASYDRSLTGASGDEDDLDDRGKSYWGGHVESGVRVWTGGRYRLVEVLLRHTWSSLGEDHNHWLLGIGMGTE